MCGEHGVKNWCGMVKEILHKCGLESLWQRNQLDCQQRSSDQWSNVCTDWREWNGCKKLKRRRNCKILETIRIKVCWHDYEEELSTDARVMKVQKTKCASQWENLQRWSWGRDSFHSWMPSIGKCKKSLLENVTKSMRTSKQPRTQRNYIVYLMLTL